MKPYFEDEWTTIHHGDCREVLFHLEAVDTVITDPPYGLEFMGKGWDRGVPGVEFWEAILAACKPGAMLLAFGGTRTFHRLTCAIEDAGFEIRDCLMWVYGSGFPKSLDVSKAIDKVAGAHREIVGEKRSGLNMNQNLNDDGWRNARTGEAGKRISITAPASDAACEWDGWGTALKPAWEPIILAMKPLDGTFAENAQTHGVAGLNIDGARIGTTKRTPASPREGTDRIFGTYGPQDGSESGHDPNVGRWPANVIHDGSDEVVAEFAKAGDCGAAGPSDSRGRTHGAFSMDSPRTAQRSDRWGEPRDERSSAARFFYCAKASRAERGADNDHPTVKPLALMEYLCKLTATPTGGVVLDPFAGSGTTLLAARRTGRKSIGIEIEEASCEIAAKRMEQGVLL